jgi:glycosyltransferase involved in cell wall biosynthesis
MLIRFSAALASSVAITVGSYAFALGRWASQTFGKSRDANKPYPILDQVFDRLEKAVGLDTGLYAIDRVPAPRSAGSLAQEVAPRRKGPRILFAQYTNPAGYPPLQHSSRILAEDGWNVWFVGCESFGTEELHFPPHPRIRVTEISRRTGAAGKLSYLLFCLRVLGIAIWWRPTWIYASDLWSCPPAIFASVLAGRRVIFHEHDSPGLERRQWLRIRRFLARRAILNVLPNEARAQAFREQTGARGVQVVHNFPSIREVASPQESRHGKFVIHYHGNISPKLMPLQAVEVLKDLPSDIVLRIVGYETFGNVGYCEKILQTAAAWGLADRVVVLPPVSRFKLLDICRDADVGVAFFPPVRTAADSYAGASNKVYDYLCAGLPVLCTENSEWGSLFLGEPYAIGFLLSDPDSFRRAVLQLYQARNVAQLMGERGRKRILSEWNYEAQFQPVLNVLSSEL